MSRGFVKEDDQEEPPFVPPRAPLPAGVDNYVTQEGYEELLKEKEELIQRQKDAAKLSDRERRREQQVIDVMMKALEGRIHTAQVIDPIQDPEEVRFGVSVRFKILPKGQAQEFKIVGVDESDIKNGKVAFTAPLIRAMTGHREKEKVTASIQGTSREIEILSIR